MKKCEYNWEFGKIGIRINKKWEKWKFGKMGCKETAKFGK